MTKIKPARVLVTNLDKFHHLCNVYLIGFCFILSDRFKHAEASRFFAITNIIFIKEYSVLR